MRKNESGRLEMYSRVVIPGEEETTVTYVPGRTISADEFLHPEMYVYNPWIYGRARLTYLKENDRPTFEEMLWSGTLDDHLREIDEMGQKMEDQIVESMAKKAGLTNQFKNENPLIWAGRMENIIATAKNMVKEQICYV